MALSVYAQNIWPDPQSDLMIGARMADLYARTELLIRSVLGSDAILTVGYNAESTYATSSPALEAFNNVGMLEGMVHAERRGCDVALVLCGNDPVLRSGRSALRIPVIGITESAMLLACTLGRKFGVITMDDASVPVVEHNLDSYGLRARAIDHRPVRSGGFHEDMSRWFRDDDYLQGNVIPQFDQVAEELIGDGAEVIVTACGGYAILPVVGHSHVSGTAVPILDATLAGAHMARTLGGLSRGYAISTSKVGSYRNPLEGPGGAELASLLAASPYPVG